MVDGSSRVGAFFRILLPLVAPGLVATSVFVFITSWNEFIFAYVLLNDQSKQTITVWLSDFYGTSRQVDWGGLMAGSILAAIPVLIFFGLVQRKIAFGLTQGRSRADGRDRRRPASRRSSTTAFVAIDDVSLTVADGEFLVLVGPSGCGKSTLLRMIAGLEEVTAGTISIGGRDVTELAPRHRDIAMVFQNYALYPHMDVRHNLAYGLKVRKTSKDEIDRRVEEVARLLGLEKLLDRKPAALSGGQRQRVAMGRAIVREPAAFLMDEPLSNLDAKLRVRMRSELTRLHERLGVTTIYVTHDQVEAMTLGQRVAVLRDGVSAGRPASGPLRAGRTTCSSRRS